jgi:hypothetical protein
LRDDDLLEGSRLTASEEATMAEAIIWEFDGVDRADYDAVNEKLNIDPEAGTNWPDGLLVHVGAAKPGGWVVFEVWESQAAQQRFFEDRLAPALEEVAVKPPSRQEWFDVAAYATPGS